MSTVKYNIYYSTSPTGPWILANSEPVEKLSQGNTYTINDLIPGTQYYFNVVGGIEVDGTFYELISQEIGPNEAKARTVDDAAVVPVSVRTLPISTHGGGGLSHQFTVT